MTSCRPEADPALRGKQRCGGCTRISGVGFCIGEPSIRSGGASNEKLFHLESLVVSLQPGRCQRALGAQVDLAGYPGPHFCGAKSIERDAIFLVVPIFDPVR
jgi:hypothetical protein